MSHEEDFAGALDREIIGLAMRCTGSLGAAKIHLGRPYARWTRAYRGLCRVLTAAGHGPVPPVAPCLAERWATVDEFDFVERERIQQAWQRQHLEVGCCPSCCTHGEDEPT